MTRKPSNRAKFGGAGLILLGSLSLALGLAYLASYLAYGWPDAPVRCAIGSILGFGAGLLGYRLASGTWSDSTVPHRAAAVAGIGFIAISGVRYLKTSGSPISQTGWLMLALSLATIATWYIRARVVRPSRRRATRNG